MTVRFSDAATVAMLAARIALVDAGSAGRLKIYDGTLPTDPDAAVTDEMIANLAFADPSFPAPSVVGANAESDAAAAVTGNAETGLTGGALDAGWCRVEDSAGNVVEIGDVGLTSSGAYLELDNLNIADGQAINITSLKLAQHRNGTAT